ncbi:MAG: hypothetical protein IPG87_19375 [Saprospiraceae bacterium]|nr:hypothetical protein [Candidatus Vicinibacter affinis]
MEKLTADQLSKVAIYVEGETDQSFINFVLYKLYGLQLEPNQMKDLIINVNGKDRLETFLELDRGRKRKALILFDADYEHNGGKALNFKKYKALLEKYEIQGEIFLFTERNSDEGELEHTIISCFKKNFSFFELCWENMLKCFHQNANKINLNLPGLKGKVYSYNDLFNPKKSGGRVRE